MCGEVVVVWGPFKIKQSGAHGGLDPTLLETLLDSEVLRVL